jgi:thioredoxin-dependent peroxiredoxin
MSAVLKIGDMAPDFETLTDAGATVKLSDYRGKRVILYFYPADDTPGCTIQGCGFRDNYPLIQEKNGVVLGVSPDGVKSHQKFKTKFDLPFTLLVDEDHKICEMYGTWGEKGTPDKPRMGVLRSHYVIDEAGKIVDMHIKVKPEDSVNFAVKVLAG